MTVKTVTGVISLNHGQCLSNASMEKIAIIDDDREIAEGLSAYLKQHHYDTVIYDNGHRFLEACQKQVFSLALLDVMMPEIDGLEVCRRLRKISELPVIFLSAAGEAFDRILGLEVGGDDYITKPFETREVLVRIKAVLRRHQSYQGMQEQLVKTSDWEISLSKRTIFYPDGSTVKFTPAVFDLFEYLYQHNGKAVSREKTFEALLNRPFEEFDRTIDIRISRLRKMLDVDPKKDTSYIQTIKGSGYLLNIPHEY